MLLKYDLFVYGSAAFRSLPLVGSERCERTCDISLGEFMLP